MTLIFCKECQRQISSDAKFCVGCGSRQKSKGCLRAFVVVSAIMLMVFASSEDTPKNSKTSKTMSSSINIQDSAKFTETGYNSGGPWHLGAKANALAKNSDGSADEIQSRFKLCIMQAANRFTSYTSHDGGRSALKLATDDCSDESSAYYQECMSRDLSEKKCKAEILVLSQTAIMLARNEPIPADY
ncbi:MAG: zinc ribbon domain-containing protein [Pseudomonadota bacterium]